MISKQAVEEMEVPVPPIEMQKIIVEFAGLAAMEQDLLRRLAEKRKQFVDAVLMELASGHEENKAIRSERSASSWREE
jgi:restriction endonuclease S subunit